MDYLLLKHLHVTLALLSVIGFTARWLGRRAEKAWVAHRANRVLPHLLDTLLLASGIWLALRLGLSPVAAPWLGAKLLGLLAYIVLASVAYRFAQRQAMRLAAFLAALAVFGWMISVALTRSPMGFLAALT